MLSITLKNKLKLYSYTYLLFVFHLWRPNFTHPRILWAEQHLYTGRTGNTCTGSGGWTLYGQPRLPTAVSPSPCRIPPPHPPHPGGESANQGRGQSEAKAGGHGATVEWKESANTWMHNLDSVSILLLEITSNVAFPGSNCARQALTETRTISVRLRFPIPPNNGRDGWLLFFKPQGS